LTDPFPLLLLASIAAGMALVTAGLVKWAADARTRTAAAVVLFLLGMMAAMLGGAILYFAHPGGSGALAGLWFASAAMSVSVFAVFAVFLQDARRRVEHPGEYAPSPVRRVHAFAGAVLSLVVLNEFLMGWTFQLAAGAISLSAARNAADALVLGVNSPWFLFPMALEMGVSAWLLRRRLPTAFVGLLLGQAALMLLSPPAFGIPGAVGVAVLLSSGLMIGLFVFLMEYLYRHRQLEPVLAGYLPALLAVYALMMAGLYVWLAAGSGLLYAVSVLLEMALFFDAVAVPERFRAAKGPPWTQRPAWAFGVLSAIFVAELFMGAVLDLRLQPTSFAAAFTALPLQGGAIAVAAHALSNGFWFFAAVTGSTWFLAMMGLEMGALVAFKLRETRSPETRIRLLLMMGCYGAFAVWFPSAYYAAVFPAAPTLRSVPVLGWSMGLGSGPVAPSVFLVIGLTYAITGGLSALFGRRVICSTFCTAPLMFQGTTMDAMSAFNRSSPLARKYLSSRFSGLYTATTGVVLGSLVGVSLLSYLDQIGRAHVAIAGTDPSVFLFAFSFSVLWYVMFVTIPYTGNYNCVTMGWCYTGAIAQAFQRIGFFRLQVRDREVCRRCTTLDCAKKCPVGLVDMPGHFRKTGSFRSSKCCGVGNCVGACPYGNLYIHDVRHWVRDRWRRGRGSRTGRELPMVSAAPSSRTEAPGAWAAPTPRGGR
jgi:polyferredoxin